ncbi:MAG: hypothetical protein HOI95_17540 [Chromatiales bacterium]|nr:hypothetical protein [Chromatiales bacterium]
MYLPTEDVMVKGRLPRHLRSPGSNYYWEMRDDTVPQELWGLAPVWVSGPILERCRCIDGVMVCGDVRVGALYVAAELIDGEALQYLLRLANEGLNIVLKTPPREPGVISPQSRFVDTLTQLMNHPNCHDN